MAGTRQVTQATEELTVDTRQATQATEEVSVAGQVITDTWKKLPPESRTEHGIWPMSCTDNFIPIPLVNALVVAPGLHLALSRRYDRLLVRQSLQPQASAMVTARQLRQLWQPRLSAMVTARWEAAKWEAAMVATAALP